MSLWLLALSISSTAFRLARSVEPPVFLRSQHSGSHSGASQSLRMSLSTPKLAAASSSSSPKVGLPTQGETTHSYWLQGDANPLARTGADASFAHDEVDIVVIGSGITGVSFVHHLVQKIEYARDAEERHVKVIMLEARDFCSGATGRNGGHFLTLPYDGFSSRSARTTEPPSKGEGMRNTLLEMATVQKIRELIDIQDWASDVHLSSNGHTRLFLTPEEEAEDLEEYNAAKEAGVPWDGITRLTKEEMLEKYGAPYPGVSIPAGSIWPVKLVNKLYELARSEAKASGIDLSLHTHTPVESVNLSSSSASTEGSHPTWLVNTSRGTLKTRFVVYATNAYTARLLPQYTMPEGEDGDEEDEPPTSGKPKCGTWIAPYRGEIAAVRADAPSIEIPQRGFASDWMEDYWIPAPGDAKTATEGKPLIIVGGGRDEENEESELGVGDDSALNPRIVKSLRGVLPRAFPRLYAADKDPEMLWSGIMGMTDTEDPIVGPVPSPGSEGRHFLPGRYIAAGFNGHGMSRAFSCAEALVEMVLQEHRGETITAPEWLPRSFSTLPE